MDALAKIAGGSVLAIGFVFTLVVLGTLFGALGGWIVGLFFSGTILSTLARFGVDTAGLSMWQLGALLGFVGGFFRSAGQSKKA